MTPIGSKTVVSRRALLKLIAATPIAARLTLLTSFSLLASRSQSHAAVPAALPLIAAAANLISGFMRGDGGMGAMLGAVNQKLDIVIGQLAQVQLALADISTALAQLPDEIDELIKQQYVIEKIASMRGAMGEYLEFQRSLATQRTAAGARPPSLAPAERQRLLELYQRFNAARRELMDSQHGNRPDAALFAPAALIFDLGINLALETPNKIFVELVRGYRAWFLRVENPSLAESTSQYLAQSIAHHHSLQNSLSSTSLGRALGFRPLLSELAPLTSGVGIVAQLDASMREAMKAAESAMESVFPLPRFPLSKPLAGTSGCHATAQFEIRGFSSPSIMLVHTKATAVTSRVTLSESDSELAKGFSVRLLTVNIARSTANWKEGQPPGYLRFTPPPGCVVGETMHPDLDAQLAASPSWRKHVAEETQFSQLVDEINAERVRIGAYLSVLSEVGKARLSTALWIQQLGGVV